MFFTKENPDHSPDRGLHVPLSKEEALAKYRRLMCLNLKGPIADKMREAYEAELRERGYLS